MKKERGHRVIHKMGGNIRHQNRKEDKKRRIDTNVAPLVNVLETVFSKEIQISG
jgi:hypothetical protein